MFRLTFWYAFVFIVSSLTAFAVFYIVIANVVRERTDQEMLRELSETVSILKSKGDDSFRTEMDFEAESEGVGNIFFRLLDPAGGEVAATDMTAWKGVGVDSDVLAHVAAGGGPVLKTVAVPGKPYEARIIYGRLELTMRSPEKSPPPRPPKPLPISLRRDPQMPHKQLPQRLLRPHAYARSDGLEGQCSSLRG